MGVSLPISIDQPPPTPTTQRLHLDLTQEFPATEHLEKPDFCPAKSGSAPKFSPWT